MNHWGQKRRRNRVEDLTGHAIRRNYTDTAVAIQSILVGSCGTEMGPSMLETSSFLSLLLMFAMKDTDQAYDSDSNRKRITNRHSPRARVYWVLFSPRLRAMKVYNGTCR